MQTIFVPRTNGGDMIDWEETVRRHITEVLNEHSSLSEHIDFVQLRKKLDEKQQKGNQHIPSLEDIMEQIRILVFEGRVGMRLDLDGFGTKTYIFRFFLPKSNISRARRRALITESYPAFAELRYVFGHSPEVISQ